MGGVPFLAVHGGWIWVVTLLAALAGGVAWDLRRWPRAKQADPLALPRAQWPPGVRGALLFAAGWGLIFFAGGELAWRSARKTEPAAAFPLSARLAAAAPFRRDEALELMTGRAIDQARTPADLRVAARLAELAGSCERGAYAFLSWGLLREAAAIGEGCGGVGLHAAGRARFALAEPDQAVADWQRARPFDDADWNLRDQRAINSWLAGDLEAARKASEEAAALADASEEELDGSRAARHRCLAAAAAARSGDSAGRAALEEGLAGPAADACALLLLDLLPSAERAAQAPRLLPLLKRWAPYEAAGVALVWAENPAAISDQPLEQGAVMRWLLNPGLAGWHELVELRAAARLAAVELADPALRARRADLLLRQAIAAATLRAPALSDSLLAVARADVAAITDETARAGLERRAGLAAAGVAIAAGRLDAAQAELAAVPAGDAERVELEGLLASRRTRSAAPVAAALKIEIDANRYLDEDERRRWHRLLADGNAQVAVELMGERESTRKAWGDWLLWLAPGIADPAPLLDWALRSPRQRCGGGCRAKDLLDDTLFRAALAELLGAPDQVAEELAAIGRWHALLAAHPEALIPLLLEEPL